MTPGRTETYDVVIVGAGHAGAQAAIALRQQKFAGSIAMVGDEPWLPYERPALSKEYLAGSKSFDRLSIRPETFWQERDIAVMLEQRAVAIDASDHLLSLASGTTLSYGKLIWAAGGEPRTLACAGAELEGMHVLRRRDDVDALMAELPSVSQIVIVGGGYIGLEAAAVLVKMGKTVTLLEAQDRLLGRVTGQIISQFYEREHRSHGVDIRFQAAVERFEGENGRVSKVRLADGQYIPTDLVLVGVGIVPAIGPLVAAGARASNGVEIDEMCRTSIPDVFAIGDCAAHANRFADSDVVRVESVQNANDQAVVVAKTLVGVKACYDAVPWFWSHQYDLKLQTVGLLNGFDDFVVRGDPETRQFSVVYLRRNAVIAVDCVNATRDYVQGRALVMSGAQPDRVALADLNQPLKDLATA